LAAELQIPLKELLILKAEIIRAESPSSLDEQRNPDGGDEFNDYDRESALASSELGPEESVISREEIKELLACIVRLSENGRLSERDLRIIKWYYIDGLSFGEIKVFLGVTTSRVAQLHKRIISELRKEMRMVK
jgi:RNA polymerase sigma factor (sigma-70 family)